jgi:maltose O-acetyltransferase
MLKQLALSLYYTIAKKLPESDAFITLGAKKIRWFLCRHIFDEVGENVNIEKNVFFGGGKNIKIGDKIYIKNNV